MRQFSPEEHDLDWHGHIEFNWLTGGEMVYQFEADRIIIPSGRLCFFWAGIPHQTIELRPDNLENYQITNTYYPLDKFLSLRGIGRIQRALLGGDVLMVPESLVDKTVMDRWMDDYRSRSYERFECLTMELHSLMRRCSLEADLGGFRQTNRVETASELRSGPTEHVVKMIEAVIQNMPEAVTTAQVAAATGLNSNYASNIFRKTLGITLKQFIIRMRLIKARELLLSTDTSIAEAAFSAGFSSVSQFYANYTSVYGSSPGELRKTV